MQFSSFRCVLFLLLAAAGSLFAAPVNLVTNPSFEIGDFTPANASDDYEFLVAGSTDITGWTVGPGDGVDWLSEGPGSPPPTAFNASDGDKSVDLRHDDGDGSISTTFATTFGQLYQLSFDTATLSAQNQFGLVSAGSLASQPFTATPSSPFESLTYSTLQFSFTATSTATELTFAANGGASSLHTGPIIDNVSVTAVPEPSPFLCFAGLGLGLGLCKYRRRWGSLHRQTDNSNATE